MLLVGRAAFAPAAGVLEEKHTDSLADLPCFGGSLTNDDHRPNGFVRARQRCWRLINTLVDLIVGVTDTSCTDLDQNLIVGDPWDWESLEFVVFVVLCAPLV